MGAHLKKAWIAFEQKRSELAAEEARKELAQDPDLAEAHGLLALCLTDSGNFSGALESAKQAIALAPDWGFAHYALGEVFRIQKRYSPARDCYLRALELTPDSADYFAALAWTHMGERRWNRALEIAENGLQCDPEHQWSLEICAISLFELGRITQAERTIATILRANPNSAMAHATLGWILADKGNVKQSNAHFREAARLDPNWEWPRAGIADVIKAHNPVYRAYLWFWKQSLPVRWLLRCSVVALVSLVIFGALAAIGLKVERQTLILTPCIVYFVFATLLSAGHPLSNLAYWRNPGVRLALRSDEVIAAKSLSLLLLLTLFTLVYSLFAPTAVSYIAAAMIFGLSAPIAMIFDQPRGKARWFLAFYALLMAAVGATGCLLLWWQAPSGIYLCGIYFAGWFFSKMAAIMAAPIPEVEPDEHKQSNQDLLLKPGQISSYDIDDEDPLTKTRASKASRRLREPGIRVFAPRNHRWLYPGTVEDTQGNRHYVVFDDGGDGWFEFGECLALELEVGSAVYCRWKGGSIYYRGTIKRLRGDDVYIHYDDGDREWNSIHAIRIPANAQADMAGTIASNFYSYIGCFVMLVVTVLILTVILSAILK